MILNDSLVFQKKQKQKQKKNEFAFTFYWLQYQKNLENITN